MNRRALVHQLGLPAAILVALALSASCWNNNDCDAGEHLCDGNVARNCSTEDQPYYWLDQACPSGTVCVVSTEAICAVDSKPNPACGSDTDHWFCDGTVAVTCRFGYVVGKANCNHCTILANEEAVCDGTGDPCSRNADCASRACVGGTCQ